jgi:hypothetical protein
MMPAWPAMPKHDLEAQLMALTQEFVGKLVHALRNASFAEVAALPEPRSTSGASRTSAVTKRAVDATPPAHDSQTAGRQTAARRAELGERVVRALRTAGRPLGVRALSTDLGVTPDLLGTPLRELRSAGKIKKHGEKRSTTYSVT